MPEATFEQIQTACNNSDTASLSKLTKADLDQKDQTGLTALRTAAHNEQILDIFLAAGADPNGGATTSDAMRAGKTPLDTAAGAGRLDLVKKLVAAGADAKLGQPLLAAIQAFPKNGSDKTIELVTYLLEHGCDPNEVLEENINYRPARALHYAAPLEGSEDLIELLIKHGAEPRARSSYGATALDLAEEEKTSSERKEKLLLGARGEPHAKPALAAWYGKQGFLPLFPEDDE